MEARAGLKWEGGGGGFLCPIMPSRGFPRSPRALRGSYAFAMATAVPSRSVLVVEDDEDIRAAIAEILEGEGYEVAIAANGSEALEELRHIRRPGLILLDLMMPVMNGHEFLARIRETPKLQSVPVLVLTAVSTEAPPGARGLLRKPFIVEELLDAVQSLCGTLA